MIERLRAALRRREDPNVCPRCKLRVNPLLHVLYPLSCPGRPPLGGWREPGRDEL